MGAKAGHLILYVDNEVISVEETARIMLDFRSMFDKVDIPFYAMDFVLCEPRNGEGQLTGAQINLYDFLYSDIYEDGLINRVQEHWDLAQEHHAIQDGLKKEMEIIDTVLEEINP